MKKLLLVFSMATMGLAALVAEPHRVSVAAAANVASVAPELETAFEKAYPGDKAEFTFGSSGNLVTQIINGAPFDVFLSADMGFAQKLAETGLTFGPVQPYAVGKLALFSLKGLNLSQGLNVLLDPRVTQIASSDPRLAPYGRAAQQALMKLHLWNKLQGKILVAQDVTQALQFSLQGADAGFVNLSALKTSKLTLYVEGKDWIEVDPSLYRPIEQGFVVLQARALNQAVVDFRDFLLSPAAQAVFTSFGYGKP
ncbi:MAG: molybdate ABC transporter substrate-binding protein [Spirochaetales bacterium]|nr:molybdate ABC transporter substrate-binding protein [Spirochaetales bacterium]